MRVYKRDTTKSIHEIIFVPPKVREYLDSINKFYYYDYYENIYGNIKNNKLSSVFLDFNTNKKEISVAFHDNYIKNKKTFKVTLPIKLIDFIEQLFDHFDQVGLRGYPDNGGIDAIVYNRDSDVYLVYIWS